MKRATAARAALLGVGLPLSLALMFGPDELLRARDITAWRERASPWAYLGQHPWGLYRDAALAEIDGLQRPQGLVARLVPPPREGRLRPAPAQVLSAAFDPEEQHIVTAGGAVAVRWDLATGRLLEEIGPAHRRDAEDARTWGYGFGEVAWAEGGQVVVGLTGSPHTLWFVRKGNPESRVRLGGHGIEQLMARDSRLAWLRNLEHGTVLALPGDMPFTLPHEEVTAMALADGGRAVTASRSRIQWWQEGAPARTLAIQAQGNPVAFSADARWALAPVGRRLELWSTQDGRRAVVEAEAATGTGAETGARSETGAAAGAGSGTGAELRAVCATSTHLAVGRDDGQVQLWSLAELQPLRSFRSSAGAIGRLVCGQQHLLAVGDHDSDARVWRLDGQAQSAPVPAASAPPLPRLSWLVQQAADGQWARRWPRLVGWLEDAAGSFVQGIAVALLVLLLVGVQLIGRAARTAAGRGR